MLVGLSTSNYCERPFEQLHSYQEYVHWTNAKKYFVIFLVYKITFSY